MSLIVETGTGSATAESYISVVDADAYFLARNNAAWAALSTADKEAALRKATDYMTATYRSRWQGARVYPSQALDWPRADVIIEDVGVLITVVPEMVKRACAELALKAATAELNPDLTQGVLQETVGPISVTYDKASPQRTRYAAIDAMLQPYLSSGGGVSMKLVRV